MARGIVGGKYLWEIFMSSEIEVGLDGEISQIENLRVLWGRFRYIRILFVFWNFEVMQNLTVFDFNIKNILIKKIKFSFLNWKWYLFSH